MIDVDSRLNTLFNAQEKVLDFIQSNSREMRKMRQEIQHLRWEVNEYKAREKEYFSQKEAAELEQEFKRMYIRVYELERQKNRQCDRQSINLNYSAHGVYGNQGHIGNHGKQNCLDAKEMDKGGGLPRNSMPDTNILILPDVIKTKLPRNSRQVPTRPKSKLPRILVPFPGAKSKILPERKNTLFPPIHNRK